MSKWMAQLDLQLVWSNKDGCIKTDIDLFIHVIDTQRHVTRKKHKKWWYLNFAEKMNNENRVY